MEHSPYISPQRVEGAAQRAFPHAPSDAAQELLQRIHNSLPDLKATLDAVNAVWVAEDLIYRFWHQSFKVYGLQDATERIVRCLRNLAFDIGLNPWFEEIVQAGCGTTFELAHNDAWVVHTRPIVDAFFHARHMLEMIVKYGEMLQSSPQWLPSGWAAVLELYQIR